ncbi:MAG: hypothetical protein Q8P18_08805 [Pseudomonadota bacterium]|nr:hypothetical protein [Pseudomonadota bacterium]
MPERIPAGVLAAVAPHGLRAGAPTNFRTGTFGSPGICTLDADEMVEQIDTMVPSAVSIADGP